MRWYNHDHSNITSLVIPLLVFLHYKSKTCSLSKKYVTFWPRLWTPSIDMVLLWPLRIAVLWILSLNKGIVLGSIVLVFQEMANWSYKIGMQAKYGQTVGKMVCKVKIVDAITEMPITFKQAFMRNVIPLALGLYFPIKGIYMISQGVKYENAKLLLDMHNPFQVVILVLSSCWGLADIITMFTDKKWRALHDIIAGTVVVRTNAVDPDLVLMPQD